MLVALATAAQAETDSVTLLSPARLGANSAIQIGHTESVKILASYNLVTTPSATLTLKGAIEGVIVRSESFEIEAGKGFKAITLPLQLDNSHRLFSAIAELLPEGAPVPISEVVEIPCVLGKYVIQYTHDKPVLANSPPLLIQITAVLPDGSPVKSRSFIVSLEKPTPPFGPDAINRPGLRSVNLVTRENGTASFDYFPPTLVAGGQYQDHFPLERTITVKRGKRQGNCKNPSADCRCFQPISTFCSVFAISRPCFRTASRSHLNSCSHFGDCSHCACSRFGAQLGFGDCGFA